MDFSAGSLFASLVVSSVGLGFFLYGKKQARFPQLLTGLALMGLPYFVTTPLAMSGVAGVLTLGLFVAVRSGL